MKATVATQNRFSRSFHVCQLHPTAAHLPPTSSSVGACAQARRGKSRAHRQRAWCLHSIAAITPQNKGASSLALNIGSRLFFFELISEDVLNE
jgi:hypothetical protein